MCVRIGLESVLKDLDPDDDREGGIRLEGGEIAADEIVRRDDASLRELAQRDFRDVQPDKVEAACDQRHEVAAVSATDVETPCGRKLDAARNREDLLHEPNRLIAAVAAGLVLGVPPLCNPIRRHMEMVSRGCRNVTAGRLSAS